MRARPYAALAILFLSCLAMAQQPVTVLGSGATNTADAAWTSATGGNTAVTLVSVQTYNSVCVTLVQGTTITGGVVTFESSIDNSTWIGVQGVTIGTTVIMGPTYTLVASTNIGFCFPTSAPYFRVRLSTVISGSGTVTIQHASQSFPTVGLLAGVETLGAGSAIIGKFTTDQTTHGTTDLVAADLTKIAGTAVSNTTAGVIDVNVKNQNNVAISAGTGAIDTGTQRIVPATGSTIAISSTNTGLPVNLPKIVNKASANVGGATVKTLTDTITSTTAGNSLIVSVCAGEPLPNGGTVVATLTETGGSDTWTLAAAQAVSTTFYCGIYYATNITGGVTAVIVTYSGASSINTTIAMEAYEVSGLIAQSSAIDTTAIGTATGTALSAGPVWPVTANELAFAAFGIGTAAQTVTLGGSGTWSNDSGQINPASGSGLFSFVAASQSWSTIYPLIAAGTITSEPWVVTLATFKPVMFSMPVPPELACTTKALINQASATAATLIAGVAGKITYVCGIQMVSATTQNVAIIEGTTATCGTATLGLFGGATAATGWNFAANGGIAFGNGVGIVSYTTVAGNNVCILPSSTGQISGSISYTQF